jgi:hypothetical protein
VILCLPIISIITNASRQRIIRQTCKKELISLGKEQLEEKSTGKEGELWALWTIKPFMEVLKREKALFSTVVVTVFRHPPRAQLYLKSLEEVQFKIKMTGQYQLMLKIDQNITKMIMKILEQ